MREALTAFVLSALLSVPVWAAEKGIAVHWDFDQGKGEVLRDRSGNKNHGKIHGAKWVKCGWLDPTRAILRKE